MLMQVYLFPVNFFDPITHLIKMPDPCCASKAKSCPSQAPDPPAKADPAKSDSGTESDDNDSIPELEDTAQGQTQGQSPLAAAAGLNEDLVSKAKQSRGGEEGQEDHVQVGAEAGGRRLQGDDPQVEEHPLCDQQA